MRPRLYWISLTFGVLLAVHAARADTFSFTTKPSPGNVSGTAGSTVGWGYSITNNSASEYLNATGIDSDLFLATDGTPDASIFDFPVLAPLQTITRSYDPVNFFGLFQFTWNPTAPAGTKESGVFTLFAQFCDSADLNNCGGTVSETADYIATVTSNTAAVPEPRSWELIGAVMAALALRRGIFSVVQRIFLVLAGPARP